MHLTLWRPNHTTLTRATWWSFRALPLGVRARWDAGVSRGHFRWGVWWCFHDRLGPWTAYNIHKKARNTCPSCPLAARQVPGVPAILYWGWWEVSDPKQHGGRVGDMSCQVLAMILICILKRTTSGQTCWLSCRIHDIILNFNSANA